MRQLDSLWFSGRAAAVYQEREVGFWFDFGGAVATRPGCDADGGEVFEFICWVFLVT